MTDVLKAVAAQLGVQLDRRYRDIIRPAPEDDRTPEAVVADIITRSGLTCVPRGGSQ